MSSAPARSAAGSDEAVMSFLLPSVEDAEFFEQVFGIIVVIVVD